MVRPEGLPEYGCVQAGEAKEATAYHRRKADTAEANGNHALAEAHRQYADGLAADRNDAELAKIVLDAAEKAGEATAALGTAAAQANPYVAVAAAFMGCFRSSTGGNSSTSRFHAYVATTDTATAKFIVDVRNLKYSKSRYFITYNIPPLRLREPMGWSMEDVMATMPITSDIGFEFTNPGSGKQP